jgi:hypothetical protein
MAGGVLGASLVTLWSAQVVLCGRHMTRYVFRLKNTSEAPLDYECEDIAKAQAEAVRYLGRYLSENPSFANEGHWQLDIENGLGQSLAQIIVATVIPRSSPIRFQDMAE